MKCKTCNHPQRRAIDLALLAKNHTLEFLSPTFGLSISSLFRHRQHLEERLVRTRQRFQNARTQGSLLKLSGYLDHVQQGVDTAAADGNVVAVFRGAHVGSRLIHQMNKMEVSLELETVYRLITSPQWASGGSLLPSAPEALAGLQQAVLDDAFFPCPELRLEPAPDVDEAGHDDDLADAEEHTAAPADAAADDEDEDEEDTAAADEEDAEDPTDPPAIADPGSLAAAACHGEDDSIPGPAEDPQEDLLSAAAPDLAADPVDLFAALEKEFNVPPDYVDPLTRLLHRLDLLQADDPETAPKIKREKSAKLPRKIAPRAKNTNQYHQDSPSEKNSPKNPHVGRESTRQGGEAQAHPAVLTAADPPSSPEIAACYVPLFPEPDAAPHPQPRPANPLSHVDRENTRKGGEAQVHPAVLTLESAAPPVALTYPCPPDPSLESPDPSSLIPDPCPPPDPPKPQNSPVSTYNWARNWYADYGHRLAGRRRDFEGYY